MMMMMIMMMFLTATFCRAVSPGRELTGHPSDQGWLKNRTEPRRYMYTGKVVDLGR